MTFADRIIEFNHNLSLGDIELPEGIRALNPFRGNNEGEVDRIMSEFYKKYYDDDNLRKMALGINPGRFGAGATGIPFTDTKRLKSECDIEPPEFDTHEMSSVFIYDVINKYSNPADFYSKFYFNSICPLGFVKVKDNGKRVNYNFYDDAVIRDAVEPFILDTLRQQIGLGCSAEKAIILGSGKNFDFAKKFNDKHGLFGELIPLEHPRYIMQYKRKEYDKYIDKYIDTFKNL
ncbi:MAG: uracil-DNA glycosylase family protein [Candidatus Kapaibacterium sp.]